MEVDYICRFIKYIGINLNFAICFFKIINHYPKLTIKKKCITIIISIILSSIQSLATQYISPILVFIPLVLLYGLFLTKLANIKEENIHAISIVSLALSYMTLLIPMIISSAIAALFNLPSYIDYITFPMAAILQIILTNLLFRIKRLKYGFSFLKNEYLKISILLLTSIMVIIYIVFKGIMNSSHTYDYLLSFWIILSVICTILIKQSFTIYQKQKNQLKTLKEYEKELAETKQKLQIAVEEKEKITKSNHEFYHRQEALKSKLNTLANSLYNTEFAEEISAISNRLNNLSDEYKHKTKVLPKLPLTGLDEIDDMISYFQTECDKNNIEFIFKLECNINNIVPKQIMKNELETLLGDLIRNSIIAINHNKSTNKSIMLVFGLADKIYQIDVYDTGINFEIDTLLNLGINRCSTHLDDGGSGIGFITTFETLARTKSSLIINELNSTKYTKFISIKFDSLNKYIINSYRAELINNMNVNNRDIMINNK